MSATLIDIAGRVSTQISISAPDTVVGATDRNAARLLEFITETGEDMVRRFDWGVLLASATMTGTGAAVWHDLPGDFSRLQDGNAVSGNVRGGLSPAEWSALTMVQGTPRFHSVRGTKIAFYPYLANASTLTVFYVSKNWITGDRSTFAADSNIPLLNEHCLRLGAIYRWKRHIGDDYSDQMAEYEAVLAKTAEDDRRMRTGL